MTFEERVKSMTGKQILQAMIDGLSKSWVAVNMNTYGNVETERYGFLKLWKKKVCFGCAATNTICQINNIAFPIGKIENLWRRADFVESNVDFLNDFECALDQLRQGFVADYNNLAKDIGVAQIPILKDRTLPILTTEGYKMRLPHYQNYCDAINEDTNEEKDH